MANIFDRSRELLKNLQSKATSIGQNAVQSWQQAPVVGGYVGQAIQQAPQAIKQYANTTPFISLPGVGFTPKLPSPTIGQYAQGQIIQPFKQGVQGLQTPGKLNKVIGGAQLLGSGFSATPIGMLWNAGTGTLGGIGRSLRTGENLNQSISRGIAQPTSLAGEGLGVQNPYLALGTDLLLTRNPKASIKNIKSLRAVFNKPIRMDSNDIYELDRAIDTLRNRSVKVTPQAKKQAKNILYNLAEKYASPDELKKVDNTNLTGLIKVLQNKAGEAGGRSGDYYIPGMGFAGKNQVTPSGLEGGGVKGKASQQVVGKTSPQTTTPTGSLSQPITGGGGPINSATNLPGGSSSGDIISDPVQKIIQALKGAKPLRGQQEKLYSKERAIRAARVASVGGRVPGEKGYFAQLGQLKGELPKVEFEGIRKQVGQQEIDSLFNMVEKANISIFEKVSAKGALAKLLGEKGGTVPNRSELELLSEIFPALVQAVLDKRPLMQRRLLSLGAEAVNLPRAVMATLDLSAPLRQGVFLVGRPKQFLPAFRDMFKYAFNEKSYKGLQENIKARPTYKLMRESKLAITDMGPLLQGREEAFMSSLAEKIPGFGVLAKASNRAYSGFLNKLRADTFDDMYKNAQKLGLTKDNAKLTDDIARFVNAATGRGKLPGAIEKSAVALNGIFFSPRLMASRLNLLNPAYYMGLDPYVRKEALKSLFTFAGTAVGITTLAKLGGADVSADPRSADFGKIRYGNTRYDILGGFQQYIRLAGQLITGQKINTQTGKLTTLGEGYGVPSRKDIALSFFESKTAPVTSFVLALLQGQNAVGEKFNLPTEAINRFIPMIVQDMYELSQEVGSPLGAIPGIFGVGVQTYGKTELVRGTNLIGEPKSQIRPVRGIGESISERVFGKQPLGSSSTTNVQAYFDQLSQLPRQEAAAKFDEIAKSDPELAKKLVQVAKDKKMGVTVNDQSLKAKGVASGERAKAVAEEFNKLKTPQEKAQLWDRYVKMGIITKDVAKQLKPLLSQ